MIGSTPILSYDRSKSNSIGSENFLYEFFFMGVLPHQIFK